jgi:hypothetical protein
MKEYTCDDSRTHGKNKIMCKCAVPTPYKYVTPLWKVGFCTTCSCKITDEDLEGLGMQEAEAELLLASRTGE